MNTKRFSILLPLVVILALVISAITPAPVLAAGEPPPPPGEKAPKASPSASEKPAPPATSTDSAYSADLPIAPPNSTPAGDSAAAALNLSVDAIARAGAVLVNATGAPVPLVTQDAVTILADAPAYFTGACGGICSYLSINGALADFVLKSGTGPIFVKGGTASSPAETGPFTINNIKKLTGLVWDDTDRYSPILFGMVNITNMTSGFLLDGFAIFGGVYADSNGGTLRLQNLTIFNDQGAGIVVTNHKGNIDLTNVISHVNQLQGALLDNTLGTGNVYITNAMFNNNHSYGVKIKTKGSAFLENVQASANTSDGAKLEIGKGATILNSLFDTNGVMGLRINGAGALKLQGLDISENATGASIAGPVISDIPVPFIGNVTITEVLFNENRGTALNVLNNGTIVLKDIISHVNPNGVQLDNKAGVTKTVSVSNSSFDGDSYLHPTAGNGLTINSRGNITLNHVRATNAQYFGVQLDNCQFDVIKSGACTGTGSVTISNSLGANEFYNNNTGLSIFTHGTTSAIDVAASSNLVGTMIQSDGDVKMSKSEFIENENEPDTEGPGLQIYSKGKISIDQIKSNFNRGNAIALDNSASSSAKTVSATNLEVRNNYKVGISVRSKGNITLNHIYVENNNSLTPTQAAVQLVNCTSPLALGSNCTGSGDVSILDSMGTNEVSYNQGMGVDIITTGAVVVNSLTAYQNKGDGLDVKNIYGKKNVTIAKGDFSQNTLGRGVQVDSLGIITLNKVNAESNDYYGAMLRNNTSTATVPGGVNVLQSSFFGNHYSGLWVESKGNITLNNVVSETQNFATPPGVLLYGAYLDNCQLQLSACSGGGSVNILDKLGPNSFSDNRDGGLIVKTKGSISLSSVTASDNIFGDGASLDNTLSTAFKSVTISKSIFNYNGHPDLYGLYVRSTGDITLNNVTADGNDYIGAYLDNCAFNRTLGYCKGKGKVVIQDKLGLNSFSQNTDDGLIVYTTGAIELSSVRANGNGVRGAYLENTEPISLTASSTAPVTVFTSKFNDNDLQGVYVRSFGAITLNNVLANNNLGHGAFLWNTLEWKATAFPAVNVLSTKGANQFNANKYNGLHVDTQGIVTVDHITANYNGLDIPGDSGVYIMTEGKSSVTISCSSISHNGANGLEVVLGTGVLNLRAVGASLNWTSNPAIYTDILRTGGTQTTSWKVCGY